MASNIPTSSIKGIEKGKKEGREEGRIEMARIMKKAGEPVEKIVEYTQPTPEEVEGL